MILDVVKGVLSLAKGALNNRQKRQAAKADLDATTAAAEGIYRENRAKANESWEERQAAASEKSYKDEWFAFLFSIPLILAFVPGMEETVAHGFEVLNKAPDWYFWCILAAVSASFAIRLPASVDSLLNTWRNGRK